MVGSRLGRWSGVIVLVLAALLGGAATTPAQASVQASPADEGTPGVPAGPLLYPLELCAADYSVYMNVHQTFNGVFWSRTFVSSPIQGWQCVTFYHDTLDQWAQIDVTVIRSDGSHQYIDTRWFNSRTQALSLYARGGEWNPWVESWYH